MQLPTRLPPITCIGQFIYWQRSLSGISYSSGALRPLPVTGHFQDMCTHKRHRGFTALIMLGVPVSASTNNNLEPLSAAFDVSVVAHALADLKFKLGNGAISREATKTLSGAGAKKREIMVIQKSNHLGVSPTIHG